MDSGTGSHTSPACNNCRVRKVKCNRLQPCQQCSHLNLPCRFSTVKTPRKPTVRGRLVRQLRDGQERHVSKTLFPKPGPSPVEKNRALPSLAKPGPLTAPTRALLPSKYTADFFLNLIADYERHAYPVNPIITGDQIRGAILCMNTDLSQAALVYAFAAVTINLTQTSWCRHGPIYSQIQDLMQRSLAARHEAEPECIVAEPPVSVDRIMTYIFLEVCYMAFQRYDRAFLILRQAISLIHMLQLDKHDLGGNSASDLPEIARRQRLYWEAFMHERFLTMVSCYSSILPPLPTGLPAPDPTIPSHVSVGFNQIIRLFLIIDDDFLAYWIAQDDADHVSSENAMTTAWVEQKQKQLDEDEISASAETERPDHDDTSTEEAVRLIPVLTELQRADIFVTRAWLRTILWQMAMSRCLLSSTPPTSAPEAMSLIFPVQRLSAQLRVLVSQLKDTKTSIGMHGSGILEKLFEITNTIADVMAFVPAAVAENQEGRQRIADLLFLIRVLFSFERIDQVQKHILEMKIETLRRMFPSIDFGLQNSTV